MIVIDDNNGFTETDFIVDGKAKLLNPGVDAMTTKATTPSRVSGTTAPSQLKRSQRYNHHLFLFQCNHASNLRTELAEVSVHRVLSKRAKISGEQAS